MYVLTENNAVVTYPYTLRMLRTDNPNVSLPKHIADEDLASFGVYRVSFDEGADIDVRTQKNVASNTPILRDGEWVIESSVVAKTQDEIDDYDEQKAISVRLQRNELLSKTDFYALSDVTMSAEMVAYRQSLRDITSHPNFPNLQDTDWPETP